MLKPSTWPSLAIALTLLLGAGCSNSPPDTDDDAGGSIADAGDAGQGDAGAVDAGVVDAGIVIATNSLSSPGYGTNPIVRQGLGVVELDVTGQGLGGFTDVSVNNPFTAMILSASDSKVTLALTVPHGAPFGPQTVTLTGPENLVVSGSFTVTPISVSVSGSDANPGTTVAPFRTVSKGLSVAGLNDTVRIADGTYSAGEQWPVETTSWPPIAPANVADGVTLQGQSTAGTLLQGPGADAGLPAGSGYAALVLQGSASVSTLSVEGFERNFLDVNGGTLTLQSVHSGTVPYDGIAINGSHAVLSGDTRLHDCGWAALALTGASTVVASNIVVDHNSRSGVYADNGSSFQCTGCELGFNGGYTGECYNDGYRDSAIFAENAAAISLTNSSFHDSSGMDVLAYGGGLVVNLDGVTSQNTSYSPRLLPDGGPPLLPDGGPQPRGCGWGVLAWNGPVASVSSSTFRNQDGYQIYADNATVNLFNSSFIDGGSYGVVASGGGVATATNSYFANQTYAQAYAGGGTFTAQGSTFVNGASDGIDDLYGGVVSLENSTFLNHRGYDVFVANAAFSSTNSNFIDGGSAAIEVGNYGYGAPSEATIVGGLIANHPNWDGVNLGYGSAGAALVDGVTITGAQSGVSAYDGELTVKNTTIESVQWYGMYVNSAAGVVEQNVTTVLDGGYYCWADNRADGGSPVVIEHSTCNGVSFVGTATGYSYNPPYWYIGVSADQVTFLP